VLKSGDLFMGFIATSITLNLLVTFLITQKLRRFRRLPYPVTGFGNHDDGQPNDPYSPVIAVVVQSASAWIIAALALLISLIVMVVTPGSSHTFYNAKAASLFLEYVFQITVVSHPFLSIRDVF
jgi:hypothetical protein